MTPCAALVLVLPACAAGAELFATRTPIAMETRASVLAVGDMNGDGRPDLVAGCGDPKKLVVLLAEGDGGTSFKAAGSVALPHGPGEIVLGDVNGDGHLDAASDSHDSYGVDLALGDGKGGLALAPGSPVAMKQGQRPHTHGLGLADFNGDGKLDLVSVNNADDDISLALGDGKGGFAIAPGSPFAVGPSPYPLAIGDLDGDGKLDIVATASATGPERARQLPLSRALVLLFGDGQGGFRASRVPLRTGEPWFVAIGDLDGDKDQDLVVTHHELEELSVLLGDGKGAFAETEGSPYDLARSSWELELADVDRDGRLDVLLAAGSGVRVLLGDGKGGFAPAPSSPFSTGGGTWRLALGDMNRDGKLDLVTCSGESNNTNVLLGN